MGKLLAIKSAKFGSLTPLPPLKTIVVVKDYIKEAKWQLNNIKKTSKGPNSNINEIKKWYNRKCQKQKQKIIIINKNVAEGLKINDTKTPKFYLL